MTRHLPSPPVSAALVIALMATLVGTLSIITAHPASATTKQLTLLAPVNGTVTSNPQEPHHTPYDGDYAWDVGAPIGTPIYARFRNASGAVSLTAEGTFEPCASPNQGKAGTGLRVGVSIDGTRLGVIYYVHLQNIPKTSGAIGVGDRLGDVSSGQSSSCWSGPHVHVEPRNDVRYSCYFPVALSDRVDGGSRLGIFGGEWATGKNQQCPSNAEDVTPAWAYERISQQAYTNSTQTHRTSLTRLRPGQRVFLTLKVKNTGSQTWYREGAKPMRLGTSTPQDRVSRFRDSTWLSSNRAASLKQNSVATGGTGTFEFWIKVPDGRGTWEEKFNLVADGTTWLPPGGISYALTVADGSPVGAHDSSTSPEGGQVRVSGWAFDWEDVTKPVDVHVYVGGPADGDYVAKRNIGAANSSRPDVGAVYPAGDNHGFDAVIENVPAGTYAVYAYAINLQGTSGSNSLIGSKSVTVAPSGDGSGGARDGGEEEPASGGEDPANGGDGEGEPSPTTPPGEQQACPASNVPPSGFVDIAGNVHEAAIDCVVWWEVTRGISSDHYGPALNVRRDQMASFLARMILNAGGTLPPATDQGFSDIAGNPHAENINRLAAAGIAHGTTSSSFSPRRAVRRDQMASFLVRAYEHLTGEVLTADRDYFSDTAGNGHQENINKVAEAGIAAGTSSTTFHPARAVRRDQMASFIARVLDVAVDRGHTTPRQ